MEEVKVEAEKWRWLYFTELQIGTPAASYFAQVDTGSDVLWLGCASCRNCPTKSNLGVKLRPYDPSDSETSSELSCTASLCTTRCVAGNPCLYQLAYGDGSTSEGYLVQDVLELPSLKNLTVSADSANLVFGCAVSASGGLQKRDQALDGILGLGQSNLSLVLQLANQKKTPQTFAHCLEGEGKGGGILVIGEVNESGLSYTPLRSNQLHYNVNLKSIQVNGQPIQWDQSSSTSGEITGTIFDSGTTLAYIPEASYLDLLQQVFPTQSIQHLSDLDLDCFVYHGSVDDEFPTVIFTFESGATLRVYPRDYFIQLEYGKDTLYCMGFQISPSGSPHLIILGDMILKDKLVVYDLENQRIGWVDFNCSSHVTVMTSTGPPTEVFSTTIGSAHVDHFPALRLTTALSMQEPSLPLTGKQNRRAALDREAKMNSVYERGEEVL
ncbi:hypothetical protein GOP47_0008676 [Adiantum capillus-veneris]|uniref:Peptidase A1 domain-containing protein n=1 Tax=Adiantum capillus-veneris TaxID=13818 RepID=A0A9D4UZB0_ADICA|nr:hypothetical protein GOP47_0008676 [Adiantum capillus-veneris]